jgi:hypothetical protein
MRVMLDFFDLLGRKIADIFQGIGRVGENRFTWDGVDLTGNQVAGGVYFVRLAARDRLKPEKRYCFDKTLDNRANLDILF